MVPIAGALVLALLQTADAKLSLHAGNQQRRHKRSHSAIYRNAGCAPLVNKFTHFTVDVEVGTPGQRFSMVADTGSNTLIVPSCVCQERGQCPSDGSENCFTGANSSSNFQVERDASGPGSLELTFGSGKVRGVVAREHAKVGHVEAFLDDGLLLMTDRALNVESPFEGILGLGVPQPPENQQQQQQGAGPAGHADGQAAEAAAKEILRKIMDGRLLAPQPGQDAGASPEDHMREALGAMDISGGGLVGASIGDALVASAGPLASAAAAGQAPLEDLLRKIMAGQAGGSPMGVAPPRRNFPKGFLEQAKVDRFSVCFNSGANGVLSLGGELPKTSHAGIGTRHWGLDFRGISVGNETLPSQALFCTPETANMTEGQRTPCGAIPDSGSTAIMGPVDQVFKLLEGICDGWDRCRKNYTAMVDATTAAENDVKRIYGFNPFNLRNAIKKTDILQAVLADCESWMDDEVGLSELPPLHFHVQGSNGTKQTLTIPGKLYIMETPRWLLNQQRASRVQQQPTYMQLGEAGVKVTSLDNIPVTDNSQGSDSGKVCTPAIGEFKFQTKTNGPVWIFGTPLFYQYVVGYDVSTNPPSMAFSDQGEAPCGTCDPAVQLWASPAADFEDDDDAWEQELPEQKETHRPIRVDALPRAPRIDTSEPL